ncbi:CLUMA_CG016132, isoform A [Clunio marinus]|uniref:CLUMA_CG016132, isoform A n=1 Tax=Clunio marinus TaxID=568069 RepID=A0A1J1ISM7_9DIPT|nr:CLUMA_CG016132, isoform A [Clunio marinus]
MRLSRLLIFFQLILSNDSKSSVYIDKVECGASLKTVSKFNCNVKKFSRIPLLNFGYTLTRKTSNLMGYNVVFRQSSGDSFNKVLELKNIEVCKMIKDASSQPFLKDSIDYIRKFNGNLFRTCEIEGEIFLTNITFGELSVVKYFPAGSYKTFVKVFDSKDANIYNLTLFSKLVHK